MLSGREEILNYARRFVGVPYVYGANGPHAFDCSGFVCFIFRKYGLIGPREDQSAQGLFEKFRKEGASFTIQSKTYPQGALVFYGANLSNITHVAIVLDKWSVIEAGGGNSRTDSIEKARAIGACVREVALRFRSDIVAVVLPNYPS